MVVAAAAVAVAVAASTCGGARASAERSRSRSVTWRRGGRRWRSCRRCGSMVKSAVWPVPQLGCCASSGRGWRFRAARHSQEEAGPLDAQPLPRVLELAASKAADFTAFDHVGARGGHLHTQRRARPLPLCAHGPCPLPHDVARPLGVARKGRGPRRLNPKPGPNPEPNPEPKPKPNPHPKHNPNPHPQPHPYPNPNPTRSSAA